MIIQLTDRHPLSNCPQLLQTTRSPDLVRRSNLNCNLIIDPIFGCSQDATIRLQITVASSIQLVQTQDPVETSSCLDFYKLVLFCTTTGYKKISQSVRFNTNVLSFPTQTSYRRGYTWCHWCCSPPSYQGCEKK